jgi:hypothetical protein
LSVDTNTAGSEPATHGIWKFSPDTDTFHHAFSGRAGYLQWSDGVIFFQKGGYSGYFSVFDPETEEVTELRSHPRGKPSCGQREPGWAYVRDHIIFASCHLMAPDNGRFLPPQRTGFWTHVERLGSGVLVANTRSGKMWHIVPHTADTAVPNTQ